MIYNYDDLTFRFLGVEEFCHDDGEFEVDARAYGAISYKLSGKASFEFSDGEHLEADGGDVLYIPAGVPYRVKYSGSKSIVIHILDSSYAEAEVVSLKSFARVELAFKKLLGQWAEGGSHNLAKAAVYEILELIKNDAAENAENTATSRYKRYLDENFTRVELSIEDMAAELHVSQSSIRRVFALNLGTSPIQYLTELRMKRAVELLIKSTDTVKEIAVECGYSDEKYFSRVFKKKYGYPPSAFLAK